MWFYIEITLLPNPEVGLNFLWSKVFQQIHLGLVEVRIDRKRVPIGISFPEYTIGEKYSVLGSKCRLIAQDADTLARFDAVKWLARLSDYVHFTSIRPVPVKIKRYAIYQREQHKTNNERLARRYANRHQEDIEISLLRYSKMPRKIIRTPFICLQSLSSDHTFCLWIKKTLVSEPSGDTFNSYGLSSATAVPEF